MKDSDINVVGLSNNKPAPKTNWKVMGAIIGIVVLAFGVIAGIILVRQQQNISEKASTAACAEQCPGTDGRLYNCHPAEADGSPDVAICNEAGRIFFCGVKNYCCPVAGGQWTADLTKCATPTPTAAVATATPTLTATSTPTSTSTSKASATATSSSKASATATSKATSTATTKASATATAVPIPVTGVEWPTIVGGGFGIIMILVSLALAL